MAINPARHSLYTSLRRIAALIVLLCGWAAPASAQVSVSGPLTVDVELEPGTTHTGTIVLENVGPKPAEVKLYQTDYRSESPALYFYDDPGSTPRSNASWIAVSPLRFSVPAESQYTVSFTIEVPADPSLSGTYWSMLMVEPVPPGSPESATAPEGEVALGVVTILRYGVRMITNVGEPGTVEPEITNARLELRDGVPTLGVEVANAGTRLLRNEIWAELYDEDGQLVARRDGSGGTLFPGSTLEYRIPLAEVPRGGYTALVVMDSGDNNVFAVSLSLSLQ
jgi:hypothetical protein